MVESIKIRGGFSYSYQSDQLIDENNGLKWEYDPTLGRIEIFPETLEARANIMARLEEWELKVLN
ncbi:hypothetical protein JKY72_05775 [Candidatus Gracilibacteria bacterium]|nr:hypothetical protein [Candidatus Gracilibacteria bacterium]